MKNRKPSDAVAAAMRDRQPPADKLEELRAAVRRQRDKEMEIAGMTERLSEARQSLYDLQHKELPDLFFAAGVDRVGLAAEGNLPAYDAKMSQYIHANIAADWPEERRLAAFAWLEKEGYGDIIKSVFEIQVGLRDAKTAKRVRAALKKLNVPYTEQKAVPWNTLTSLVRELAEEHQSIPKDLLGVTMGPMVKLKERKD